MAKNKEETTTDTTHTTADDAAKLEAHRESVRKGAAARKAAVEALIKAHQEEFDGYLATEKEARGIKSWDARKKERAQRDFLKLLAENPELAALIAAQAGETTDTAEAAAA